MTDIKILKRLFNNYTKKYLKNIIVSVFFTVLLAGSTSAVAYLLKIGFIMRTPQGRKCTKDAFDHLGLIPPKNNTIQKNFFE